MRSSILCFESCTSYSLCMLIGRLEVFPVLMLVSPTAWRR